MHLFGKYHNNRPRQALDDPSYTAAPSEEKRNRNSEAFDTTLSIKSFGSEQACELDSRTIPGQRLHDSADFVTTRPPVIRSQSITGYPSPYERQDVAEKVSFDDLIVPDNRQYLQQIPPSLQAPAIEPRKSRGLFDRMRSSSHRALESNQTSANQPSYSNKVGLTRRVSKTELSPTFRPNGVHSVEGARLEVPLQDPRPFLPSPQEESEDLAITLEAYHFTDKLPDERVALPPSPAPDQQTVRTAYGEPVQNEQLQQYQQKSNLRSNVNLSRVSLARSESYVSFESVAEQRDERGPHSANDHSPPQHPNQRPELPDRTSSRHNQNQSQSPRRNSQYDLMAPPPTGTAAARRSADSKITLQGQGQQDSRDGPSPSYNRGTFPGNQPPTPGLSPLPPGNQGPTYRAGSQRDQYQGEQGGQPSPPQGERDLNDNYKELLTKYKKVKGLYFEKTAQVEQLQNTLANQRLSQSRTSLDDSEYMTRFQRLEGAVTNLAFNIRKDWRSVPAWLSQSVNQDALKIGKQEMTAVGRAVITKFLVDEVFNRTFHPGLSLELSTNLKAIEQNIRKFSPALNNQEESDALTAKVVQWRLSTLEGLRDVIASPDSEENRKQFADVATMNLTSSLTSFLQEPPPPGIEDSAHMIVELTVSIAANLPLESRDISIIHPLPGDVIQPVIMKIENPIPALVSPGAETDDAESTHSGDKDESGKEDSAGKTRKEKKGQSMLQGLMTGNPSTNKKDGDGKKEDGNQKVRFAGFVGVEVRGRQILVKAPVWVMG